MAHDELIITLTLMGYSCRRGGLGTMVHGRPVIYHAASNSTFRHFNLQSGWYESGLPGSYEELPFTAIPFEHLETFYEFIHLPYDPSPFD